MEPVEQDRRKSKGEVERIGSVGRKSVAAGGARIGLASFASKLSCQNQFVLESLFLVSQVMLSSIRVCNL